MGITIKKGCRITSVNHYTEDEFSGSYRKHTISIDRESNNQFYIMVHAPCGMCDYDGYWTGNSWQVPMIDAIKEALKGSELIGS